VHRANSDPPGQFEAAPEGAGCFVHGDYAVSFHVSVNEGRWAIAGPFNPPFAVGDALESKRLAHIPAAKEPGTAVPGSRAPRLQEGQEWLGGLRR